MPRQLKRRSDAISRDASEAGSDDSPEPPRRRQRSNSDSPPSSVGSGAEEEADDGATQAETQKKTLVKKLVRLALASEYSRIPLRRADISTKIFKDGNQNGRQFKGIFEEAQRQLKAVFGMQLVELPSKEKTSIKDRRAQATQDKAPSKTSKSWILVSVLPKDYRENKNIMQPARAPSVEAEATYTSFYSMVVTLIYFNSNELPEQKLERYLQRLNADMNTPMGSLEKTLARMIREGVCREEKGDCIGRGSDQLCRGP